MAPYILIYGVEYMANLLYRESTTPTLPSSTSAKGSPLTNQELDANFKSLNDAKLEGIVGTANGGTGLDNPGPAGNVLVSNGTFWTSQTPQTGITTGKSIAMAIVFGF